MADPSQRARWQRTPLPLTVVAEGLDELVFGHRGATLDAGLPGLLAQLLDGLLL
jgi:hypothetical protein